MRRVNYKFGRYNDSGNCHLVVDLDVKDDRLISLDWLPTLCPDGTYRKFQFLNRGCGSTSVKPLYVSDKMPKNADLCLMCNRSLARIVLSEEVKGSDVRSSIDFSERLKYRRRDWIGDLISVFKFVAFRQPGTATLSEVGRYCSLDSEERDRCISELLDLKVIKLIRSGNGYKVYAIELFDDVMDVLLWAEKGSLISHSNDKESEVDLSSLML